LGSGLPDRRQREPVLERGEFGLDRLVGAQVGDLLLERAGATEVERLDASA
jgi:hypothetical protein